MGAPRHSNNDRSFGRSATATAVRGGLLLALAVVLGIVLLRANSGGSPTSSASYVPATSKAVANSVPDTTLLGAAPVDSQPLLEITTTTAPVAGGRPHSQVKVLVVNGSGVVGKASKVSALLTPAGWNLLPPATATSKGLNSAIFYQAGFEQEAAAVAATFSAKFPLKTQPMSAKPATVDAVNSNVLLVVGKSLAAAV